MTDYSRSHEYGMDETLNVLCTNIESALSGAGIGEDDYERREIVKCINELISEHVKRLGRT